MLLYKDYVIFGNDIRDKNLYYHLRDLAWLNGETHPKGVDRNPFHDEKAFRLKMDKHEEDKIPESRDRLQMGGSNIGNIYMFAMRIEEIEKLDPNMARVLRTRKWDPEDVWAKPTWLTKPIEKIEAEVVTQMMKEDSVKW